LFGGSYQNSEIEMTQLRKI